MPEYAADLPEDDTLLVHCASGARAAAASAFLAGTGRDVKYVNDAFENRPQPQKPAESVA
jgi:hydroxyacylglutathione hydrolase